MKVYKLSCIKTFKVGLFCYVFKYCYDYRTVHNDNIMEVRI